MYTYYILVVIIAKTNEYVDSNACMKIIMHMWLYRPCESATFVPTVPLVLAANCATAFSTLSSSAESMSSGVASIIQLEAHNKNNNADLLSFAIFLTAMH